MRIQPALESNGLLLCGVLLAGALALVSSPLEAQAPSNALTVKLLDAIDSAQASAGQRFRAAVAKDTAIAGVFLAKGADATVVLAPGTGGYRWTLNLIEVTVNGKVAGVLGQNPTVVPTSAADFLTMSKKTVTTRDRIAVAAGENVRFVLGPAPTSPAPASSSSAQQSAAVRPAPAAMTASRGGAPPSPTATLLGPPPDAPPARTGNADAVFHDLNFEVRLTGCARQGTASSTCTFVITNQGEDRQVGIGPASHFGVVDSKGQAISFTAKQFAGGSRNWSDTVSGLPVKATFTYAGLDPGVTSLARVSLNLGTLSPRQDTQFEWRNVAVAGAGPTVSAAMQPPSSGSVVEVDGWNLTLERCSTLPREDKDAEHMVVECFMKIVNLKADRDFRLGGATLIDFEGRNIGTRWYKWDHSESGQGWVGDAADYARMRVVPPDLKRDPSGRIPLTKWVNGYQPPVSGSTPIYVWAVFSDVDPNATRVAQVRWCGAVFRDIPLTPAPPLRRAPLGGMPALAGFVAEAAIDTGLLLAMAVHAGSHGDIALFE